MLGTLVILYRYSFCFSVYYYWIGTAWFCEQEPLQIPSLHCQQETDHGEAANIKVSAIITVTTSWDLAFQHHYYLEPEFELSYPELYEKNWILELPTVAGNRASEYETY
jgi:hypothetical protein